MRENADQKNSKNGNFSRIVYDNFIESSFVDKISWKHCCQSD